MTRTLRILQAWALLIATGLALLSLIGCSSNNGSNAFSGSTSGQGRLLLTIQWPQQTRVIPAATTHIKVTIIGVGLEEARVVDIPRPTGTSSVTTNALDLPIGSKSINAEALNDSDAVLANGTTTVTIVNDRMVNATITLAAVQGDVESEIALAVQDMLAANAAVDAKNLTLANTKIDSALGHLNLALSAATAGSTGAQKAHFYWALARLAKMGIQEAITLQPLVNTGTAAAMTGPGRWLANDPVSMLLLAAKASSLSGSLDLLQSDAFLDTTLPTRRFTMTTARTRVMTDSQIYQLAVTEITNTILPALTAVQTHWDALKQTDLALTLQNPLAPADPSAFVVIDYGDICLLSALNQLLSGALNQALAYNLNPGTFDIHIDITLRDANSDGVVTPAEYLPPAPFGALKSGGAALLTSSLQSYRDCLADLKTGCSYHLQPATGGQPQQLAKPGELLAGANPQELAIVRDGAIVLATAFNGPATLSPWISTLSQDVRINLPALFTSPVANLRTIAPDYTLIQGWADADLTTIDDLTFGGLFPNSLPTEVLYQSWDPNRLFGDLTVTVD